MSFNYTECLQSENGLSFWVKVKPRASTNQIKWEGCFPLKISVKAMPVNGKANAMVVDYLTDLISLKSSKISILFGLKGTYKKIFISHLKKAPFIKKLDAI